MCRVNIQMMVLLVDGNCCEVLVVWYFVYRISKWAYEQSQHCAAISQVFFWSQIGTIAPFKAAAIPDDEFELSFGLGSLGIDLIEVFEIYSTHITESLLYS
jgi:hypothetical protein